MHLCLLLQVARHPLMGLPGLNEQSSEVSCVLCWFNMHTLHTTAYINISLLLIIDGFMMVGITVKPVFNGIPRDHKCFPL
jgi:hypothetical protein